MRVTIIGIVVMDNETLEYVQRSKYRQNVLKALENEVLMPKEIAERSDIKTNYVSKVLSELRSKELIEVLDDSVRKGRLYRTTNKGKVVTEQIK